MLSHIHKPTHLSRPWYSFQLFYFPYFSFLFISYCRLFQLHSSVSRAYRWLRSCFYPPIVTEKLILHFIMVTQFKYGRKAIECFPKCKEKWVISKCVEATNFIVSRKYEDCNFFVLNFFVNFFGGWGWGDTNFMLVQVPSCLVCSLLLLHYDKILNMYYI